MSFLVLSDQIEQASQAFVFDDRRLLHLADLVEGSVWQVDAFVADDQATAGKIEDGRAFADGRLYHLCRLQDKAHLTHTEVLAVRCPFETKKLLIAAAPDIFFDDNHYRGYRAVLVRLPAVAPDELDSLLRRACDFQAARQKSKR